MAKRSMNKVQNYTIVQANDLIRNKKNFSLWELRIFALLASQVKRDDDDFKTYKFRIKDILDLFETKSNNLHDEIRQIPEKLHAKLIRIPYIDQNGKNRIKRYNLISMSDVPDDKELDEGDYIMLRFDKDLKSLMLKLGEHFTVYKFYNILKLRSPYIFQLYELLKSEEYKGNGKINIDLSELREILQIPKSYKYGNIRQRILDPAKEQFQQHTDIVFEYEPIKGRAGKMRKLRFWVYKNRKSVAAENGQIEAESNFTKEQLPPPSPAFDELFPEVKKWVAEPTFRKWLSAYPEEQIRTAIQHLKARMKKGEKITNIPGYLFTLIKQPVLFNFGEARKNEHADKKRKIQEAKDLKQGLELQKKEILSSYQIGQEKIINTILQEKPEVKKEVFEVLKTSRMAPYDSKKTEAENLANPMFLASFRNIIKKKFPERFKELDATFLPKIKQVKAALRKV